MLSLVRSDTMLLQRGHVKMNVISQHCGNIATMLWQHCHNIWKSCNFMTLPQYCYNIENEVISQHSHNIQTHCVNIVWTLVPNAEIWPKYSEERQGPHRMSSPMSYALSFDINWVIVVWVSKSRWPVLDLAVRYLDEVCLQNVAESRTVLFAVSS